MGASATGRRTTGSPRSVASRRRVSARPLDERSTRPRRTQGRRPQVPARLLWHPDARRHVASVSYRCAGGAGPDGSHQPDAGVTRRAGQDFARRQPERRQPERRDTQRRDTQRGQPAQHAAGPAGRRAASAAGDIGAGRRRSQSAAGTARRLWRHDGRGRRSVTGMANRGASRRPPRRAAAKRAPSRDVGRAARCLVHTSRRAARREQEHGYSRGRRGGARVDPPRRRDLRLAVARDPAARRSGITRRSYQVRLPHPRARLDAGDDGAAGQGNRGHDQGDPLGSPDGAPHD